MLNLKNHTTPLFFPLSGDRGDQPAFATGATFKFNLSSVPFTTRRMCNYLVGIMVTVVNGSFTNTGVGEPGMDFMDASDVLRGLFDSAEVQQTMFGTPVSANHYLGKYFGLFEYISNGMQIGTASFPPLGHDTTTNRYMPLNFFVPLSALLGMKGHHTAQPVVCYDRAQFILRTAAAGKIHGFSCNASAMSLKVSAVVLPEPELRLGPGTSWMQYVQAAPNSGAIVAVDALGNSTTLEGAEPGAGLAAFLWMGRGDGTREYGGAANVEALEYVSVPFRDLQMTRHLDPFIADWMNACGMGEVPATSPANLMEALSSGGHRAGYMYAVNYPGFTGGGVSNMNSLTAGAEFLPLITPRKFLETSKMQVVQGSQSVGIKATGGFSGQHIFTALQYHSWTPAKQEEVLKKLIDTGVAQTVWGTNDLVPKTKITNKQPAGSINPSKTRFFATTWEPKTVVSTPPSTT